MRARVIPAATLMRGAVVPIGNGPIGNGWRSSLRLGLRNASVLAGVAMALALFTIFTAVEKRIGAWFVLGSVGAFLAFPALAQGLMFAAARVRKPKFAALRLALANLHRPGAPTP